MQKTIPATEARVRFGELMRNVVAGQGAVIVERDGEAQVVILSLDEYARLKAGQNAVSDWAGRVDRLRARIAATTKGRPLPPPEKILQELRDERDGELLDLR